MSQAVEKIELHAIAQADASHVNVTRWPGETYAARHGRLECWSWPAVVSACRSPLEIADKHAAPGWAFVVGRGNRRRRQDVTEVTAIVLDVDRGVPGDLEAVTERLKQAGVCAVLHTTHSHRAEVPRFRVILPLAVPIDPTDFDDAWRRCVELIGVPVDVAGRDASHTWRMPSHAPNAPYEYRTLDGVLIDLTDASQNRAQEKNAAGIPGAQAALGHAFEPSGECRGLPEDTPLKTPAEGPSSSFFVSRSARGQAPVGADRDDSRSGQDFREALRLLRAGHDLTAVCDLLLESSAKAAALATLADPNPHPSDVAAHQRRAAEYVKRTVRAAQELVSYAMVTRCRVIVDRAYDGRPELTRLLVTFECAGGMRYQCRIVVPIGDYATDPVWDRWEALTEDLPGETLNDLARALEGQRVVLRLEDGRVQWAQRVRPDAIHA